MGYNDLESGTTTIWTANSTPQTIPALWGIPLKYLSLVTLAVQNSALTILMHYSRIPSVASPEPYSAAAAVLTTEVLKGLISLVVAFVRADVSSGAPAEVALGSSLSFRIRTRSRQLWKEVFGSDCWKLSIPAILYVLQNNLQYTAVSNLPAATFQVTYQMKILTTAIFSVLLLRKRLSSTQWFSLLCLAIGVAIVQIQASTQAPPTPFTIRSSTLKAGPSMDHLKGFSAIAASCVTSGLAGVYFEMVLKNTKTDLWVRNIQLSLFSILPALVPIISTYRQIPIEEGGFLASLYRNFTPAAWATVGVQVLGGLITALVIKYSDNILKGFATSLSILISFALSVVIFKFHVSGTFMLGSSIVVTATYMYNTPPRSKVPTDMDLQPLITPSKISATTTSTDSLPQPTQPRSIDSVKASSEHPFKRSNSSQSLRTLYVINV